MTTMVLSLRTNTICYDWAVKAYGYSGWENMVGVIPHWCGEYDGKADLSSLSSFLCGCYGFPVDPMAGSKVLSNGNLKSPYAEDPELKPMAMTAVLCEDGVIRVYSYEYGVVGLVKGNESIVHRFD